MREARSGMEGVKRRVAQVANEVAAPQADENDRNARFPKNSIEALGKAGLLGLTVPESHGGMGLGHRASAVAVEELAKADPSLAMVYLMHLSGVACIAEAPESGELDEILREIAKGRHLTTIAFSERGSRSHFWAPVSRLERGKEFRISAEKSYVTSANHADTYVVNTQIPDAHHPTETMIFLVDRASPGIIVEEEFDGLGLRGNDSAPVRFEDVVVPEARRIGPVGGGFRMLMHTILPVFALGSAAVSLGICRSTVDISRNHMETTVFEHLAQSLGEISPNLRSILGRMEIETDALAAYILETVLRIEDAEKDAAIHTMGVKAFGGRVARQVTSWGMEVCGGAAFSKRNAMERFFRDAQAATVMAPTTLHLEDLVGRGLLDHPWF
jgi:alkylation response protein AidB-like acyl-CoA dehydrogenase